MTSSAAPVSPRRPLRFAILGNGAIAAEVRRLVESLDVAAADIDFIGTVSRQTPLSPQGSVTNGATHPFITLDQALATADVVVEAASVGAVSEHGPRVIAAGRDLLVASVGAFADPTLYGRLRRAGTGRVHLTSGAIGGLDLIAAAGRTGGLDWVLVRSRKLPASLVQRWMNATERAELLALKTAHTLFEGTPEDAIEQFPTSLNVTVAVGLALGEPTLVRVELIADPTATLTTHEITAAGAAGEYSFSIRNTPLQAQPSSSGLTARALVADLLRLAERRERFV